ncbi:hypothetical protein OIE66_13020 [Nonomuraea sp. NBC_01738]|uniref:hypothetical protein n=1 Tax=Nonomuraea sp. NBC_01738 TaxID=2976003 RepID=UPI002E0F065D|nr:hypothetical protein OIE66_13020 [Nonomuraea sp. NBC_01738]
MRFARSLACLAAALTAVALAPSPAQAATGWGPYHAPGKLAKAAGTLKITGEDHADLPVARTATVKGYVTDLARPKGACGWLVLQFAVRKGSNFVYKQHPVRDCSYRSKKSFTATYHDVYQVELKVCAGRRTAKPSIECLAGGTWKILYTSPH